MIGHFEVHKTQYTHLNDVVYFSVYGLDGSGLLRHLCEAGLLHDVSSLVGKAQARDEGNLRKVQVQARGKLIEMTVVYMKLSDDKLLVHCS